MCHHLWRAVFPPPRLRAKCTRRDSAPRPPHGASVVAPQRAAVKAWDATQNDAHATHFCLAIGEGLVFDQIGQVAQVDVPLNEHASAGFPLCVVQADINADVVVSRMARVVDYYLFTLAGQPRGGGRFA